MLVAGTFFGGALRRVGFFLRRLWWREIGADSAANQQKRRSRRQPQRAFANASPATVPHVPWPSVLEHVEARRIAQGCKAFLGSAQRGRRALSRRFFGKPFFPFRPPGPLADGSLGLPRVRIRITFSGRPSADLIRASGMPRLADDARIVSAAAKHERQFVGGYKMRLVDGPPGCDMIGHRA